MWLEGNEQEVQGRCEEGKSEVCRRPPPTPQGFYSNSPGALLGKDNVKGDPQTAAEGEGE